MSEIIILILIIYSLNGITFFITREVLCSDVDCLGDVFELILIGLMYSVGWIGIYLEGKK